jgi:hypothetical protein
MLQHGSILMEDDQPRIEALATVPLTRPIPAATLRESLGRSPSYAEVRDALAAALEDEAGSVTPLDEAEAGEYAVRHHERFTDADWTWRR